MNWREILTVLIMALGVFASGVLIGYGRGGRAARWDCERNQTRMLCEIYHQQTGRIWEGCVIP